MNQSNDKDGQNKDASDKASSDNAVPDQDATEATATDAADTGKADATVASSDPQPNADSTAAVAKVEDPVDVSFTTDADQQALDDAHGGGSTLAGMALRFLIIVLVVFGLSLWLVPMIAPHLPATIAKHIMPGQKELDARLAALEQDLRGRTGGAVETVGKLEKQIADLTVRLAEAEATASKAQEEAAAAQAEAAKSARAAATSTIAEDVVAKAEKSADAAAEAATTATTAATEAGKVAAAATRDTASLARRMTSFEARAAALSEELGAMSGALAKAPAGEGGAANPELAAAFAALQTKVDGLVTRMAEGADYLKAEEADRFATQDDLRSARTALQAELKTGLEKLPGADKIAMSEDIAGLKKDLDGRLGTIEERVKAAEDSARAAATAAETAAAATTKATGKVDNAIRNASVRAAVAAMTSRLNHGVSFAGALGELEGLTGTDAPAVLKDAAGDGVTTTDALIRAFGRQAQKAIAADIRAGAADDGLFGKASARLRSVVAGRPKAEEEGEGTAAIVSRIEARLHEGALPEALSEAGALDAPAQEALAGWLDQLRARVAVDAAAASYIEELTRQQG